MRDSHAEEDNLHENKEVEVELCPRGDIPTEEAMPEYDPEFSSVAILPRRLGLEEKKKRKAESERDNLRESLARLLAPDQMHMLEKGTMRGSAWSDAAIQSSLSCDCYVDHVATNAYGVAR